MWVFAGKLMMATVTPSQIPTPFHHEKNKWQRRQTTLTNTSNRGNLFQTVHTLYKLPFNSVKLDDDGGVDNKQYWNE